MAHLCKAPWAASDLLLASGGGLVFKSNTRQDIEKLPKDLLLLAWRSSPFWQRAGSCQGEPVHTALMLALG